MLPTRFTRKPLKTLNFRTGPSKAILIICSLVFMGDKKTAVNAVIFSVVTYEKTILLQLARKKFKKTKVVPYEVLTYRKVQETRLTNEFINV